MAVKVKLVANREKQFVELLIVVDTLVVIDWAVLGEGTEFGREEPWQDGLSNDSVSSVEDENSVEKVKIGGSDGD